jgi:Cof subfamily protein (haloacid dehalogenase superfamily)
MKGTIVSSLPYRLCAIDLDDTLLGPDHRLSERNCRAIRAVIAQGVTVVLASGRMFATTVRFAEQLDLDTPVISYNGALVKNPRTGEVWLQECVAPNLAARVLDYCRERRLQLNYYLNDHLYTAEQTPWLDLYHRRTSAPFEIVPDFYTALREEAPTKVIIVDAPETIDRLLPYFRAMFGEALYVTKSNAEYLEFLPPKANKGAALELVTRRFGITAGETLAFGDSWNDIPMLQWAGLGIAVGNAKPEVIAAADRTVRSNAEDGVGVALEEIFGV